MGHFHLRPGQVYDWSVSFVTGNLTRMPVTLEGTAFANGLPAHLHRAHEGVMLTYDYGGATGWPPKIGSVPYPQRPLPGYRLATPANTRVTISEGVVADRPGIYVIGPLTIGFAVQHPLLGQVLGLRQATTTTGGYGVACYDTRDASCASVMHSVANRF